MIMVKLRPSSNKTKDTLKKTMQNDKLSRGLKFEDFIIFEVTDTLLTAEFVYSLVFICSEENIGGIDCVLIEYYCFYA